MSNKSTARRTHTSIPPPRAVPTGQGAGQVDNGALPSDGEHTVSQPEPQRESAAARHEKPATGITPSGAAGGRRM